MMSNEKPGDTANDRQIDMAVWDAIAKVAEKPLFQLLAERYGVGVADPKVFVCRWWLLPSWVP
jgi:D(-)-tartrate dehydratase